MSNIPRFGAYAAAFEKAYESDDWTLIAPFFAEAAVYDTGDELLMGGVVEGRDAIQAYFKRIVDSLDRRFGSRELVPVGGPVEEGDTVRVRGKAVYRSEGLPDFVLDLEETATFSGDVIVRLEDRFDAAVLKAARAYLAEHGAALGIAV